MAHEHLSNFLARPVVRVYEEFWRPFRQTSPVAPQFFTTLSPSVFVQLRLRFAAGKSREWLDGWMAGEGGVLRIKCSLHLTLLGSVCPPCSLPPSSVVQSDPPLPTASFVLIAPGEMTHTDTGPYPTLDRVLPCLPPRENYTPN